MMMYVERSRISPGEVVACGLRLLGGEPHKALEDTFSHIQVIIKRQGGDLQSIPTTKQRHHNGHH
jgi:hypothetical protein